MTEERRVFYLKPIARPLPDVRITAVGMYLDRPLSFEEWEGLGLALGEGGRAYAWSTGDWLAYGEHEFPDRYSQAMDATGLSLGRLRNLNSLCARVPHHVRNPSLSLSHHESVAPFNEHYQRQLLDMAYNYGIDRDSFRSIVAEIKAGADPDKLEQDGQVVIQTKKLSKDQLIELARHVVLAWANENEQRKGGMGMILHEALSDLAAAIEEEY